MYRCRLNVNNDQCYWGLLQVRNAGGIYANGDKVTQILEHPIGISSHDLCGHKGFIIGFGTKFHSGIKILKVFDIYGNSVLVWGRSPVNLLKKSCVQGSICVKCVGSYAKKLGIYIKMICKSRDVRVDVENCGCVAADPRQCGEPAPNSNVSITTVIPKNCKENDPNKMHHAIKLNEQRNTVQPNKRKKPMLLKTHHTNSTERQ